MDFANTMAGAKHFVRSCLLRGYPLVNVYIANWKITIFHIGKRTN